MPEQKNTKTDCKICIKEGKEFDVPQIKARVIPVKGKEHYKITLGFVVSCQKHRRTNKI